MDESKTIVSKMKRNVPLSKTEILMMLRTYQIHPSSWVDIISDMRGNLDIMPPAAQELYNTSTFKQIRDRLANKLKNSMSARIISDDEIRSESDKIKQESLKHTTDTLVAKDQAPCASATSTPPSRPTSEKENPGPSFSKTSPSGYHHGQKRDRRDELTETLTSGPESSDNEVPQKKKQKQEGKRLNLPQLMRKNQEKYYRFITKKVPRLLQSFGISDSDSDSDE